MNNLGRTTCLFSIRILILVVLISAVGCAQVEQIPAQVHEDLPNPVSDFRDNDKFSIGLKWYKDANFDIARKFWQPLAESGDCDAEYSMGLLYYSGAGVRRSYEKAHTWWTRAAEQGQGQAQAVLGASYTRARIPYIFIDCRKGCGTDRDLVEGYKWFGLASESSSPRIVSTSQSSIERISAQMSAEQIEEAQQEINNWKPNPSKCTSRDILIAAPSSIRAFY